MVPRAFALLMLAAGATTPVAVVPAELKPSTLASFNRYVRATEARMDAEIGGRSAFLWIDRRPVNERSAYHDRLARGEIVSARLETRDGTKTIEVEDGLIHHWVGTVLLPGVKLDRAMAFVQDYVRYPEVFAPLIQRSRVLSATPTHFDVSMRTSMHKVVTVVIDADYSVDYRRLSASRLYTKSEAKNIFQVESAGQADEKRVPGDESSGYLWRINTYCWFDERDEGTYEQCESISLTRGVPFGFGWLVNPFVSGIPRETLEFTLGRVRAGLAK
jgi:hypothetical protein